MTLVGWVTSLSPLLVQPAAAQTAQPAVALDHVDTDSFGVGTKVLVVLVDGGLLIVGIIPTA